MTRTFEQRLFAALKPRARRNKSRRGPMHSASRRAWVRTLPCIVCIGGLQMLLPWIEAPSMFQQEYRTECAHVGDRGIGQRCSDEETLPLCGPVHHREGPASAHKLQKLFWNHHGIDRDESTAALSAAYNRLRKAAA